MGLAPYTGVPDPSFRVICGCVLRAAPLKPVAAGCCVMTKVVGVPDIRTLLDKADSEGDDVLKVTTQFVFVVPVMVRPLNVATPLAIVAGLPAVTAQPLDELAAIVPDADVTTLPPESSTFTIG